MTRHARNCTAGAVYTYHEKKKDTKSGGYGTQQERIGKDSVKDFDCCCLTLQPCRYPVITPEGYIYDKEAILEFIIHQKKEYIRRMKEYERQKNKESKELADIAKAEQEAKAQAFAQNEKTIVSLPGSSSQSDESNMNTVWDKAKTLPSFWVPSLTPDSKDVKIKKPKKDVLCPMSGNPIKAKDLMTIQFTPINDPDDKGALIAKKCRYKCAVTHDVLGNNTPCAVLKTSGNIVTMECVEKLIRKDMIDPTNGKVVAEKDILPIQRGGTGYASTNEKLDAKLKKPVMMA